MSFMRCYSGYFILFYDRVNIIKYAVPLGFYLSLGNIIRATMTMKNTQVWKKNPSVVGQPDEEATENNRPNTIWLRT